MSNIPYSTINRTFEKLNITKIDKIGSGKSAVVYVGKTNGGHRRAVRIFKLGDIDDNFTFEDYNHVKKLIKDKHLYIYKLMKDRIPRLYDIHMIHSKRNESRILALAQVTQWIDGPTLGSIDHSDMTDIMISDLRSLLRKMWSNRISHGDLFQGNVIYNSMKKKWMILDLDNIKIHKSSYSARERDIGMMDPIIKGFLKIT